MKYEIIELESVFSKNNIEHRIMKGLTGAALFDDTEKVRKEAYNSLNKRYDGIVKGGFEKSGVMFLFVQFDNSPIKIIDLGFPEIKYSNPSIPFKINNKHK
jgi:hypothetical protein